MIQFTQNYIQQYLRPLLLEVLSTMGKPELVSQKAYLKKLLKAEQLSAMDQKQFMTDYFSGKQPAQRPFMKEEEAPYRQYFLQELADHIRMRIRLAGEKGMREAIIPIEERAFGVHQALTLNINKLSFQLAINFEKRIIAEQLTATNQLTAERQADLNNGRLKVMLQDDKLLVVTKEDLDAMPKSASVTPMVQPGLRRLMQTESAIEDPTAETLEVPQVSASVQEVQADFAETEAIALQQQLEQSGLEVIADITTEQAIASGTVRDMEGQELAAVITTNKAHYEADKFTFKFSDVGPHPDLKGQPIRISQDDLPSIFFDDQGNRKSALQVFQEQNEVGEELKEKYRPIPKERPPLTINEGEPPINIPTSDVKPKTQLPEPVIVAPTEARATPTVRPLQLVQPGAQQQKGGKIKPSVKTQDSSLSQPSLVSSSKIKQPIRPAPPPESVMDRKRQLAEEQKSAEAKKPQATPKPLALFSQRRQAAPRRRRSLLPKLAAGVAGGSLGLLGAGMHWAATSDFSSGGTITLNTILSLIA